MSETTLQTTNIAQLIDSRPLSGMQIRVIIFSGLVVLFDGYDIQTISLAIPSLVADWSLTPPDFKWALTASLVGILLGALFVAPLGDRWGRRTMMIATMALVGVASLCTGFSSTVTELVFWRFLTGVGLGASMPNATALTSEYVPAHRRASLITLMYCNIAFGALIAGFVAPAIIERFDWHGLFYVGGILPLALCLVLLIGVPESVRLLMARRRDDPRITQLITRLAPDVDPRNVQAAPHESVQRKSALELIAPTYRSRTLLLWIIFGLNLFGLYFLINWLPAMLTGAGWSRADALRGGVLLQFGGIVSGLILSWCVDHGKTVSSMIAAYLMTALSLGLFLVFPSSSWGWWMLLFTIGAGTSGTQFALNALAAAFYPPIIRATGVGWAVGIGRIGAIVSPLVGGWILGQHLATAAVLGLLAVPILACAASVTILPRVWQGTHS